MADPLSIIGAIAAIVQVSSTVVDLMKTVKDAPKDRRYLIAEINHTTSLCQILKSYAENDAAPWMGTFQTLCEGSHGPIEQFNVSLRYLETKLAPGHKGALDHQSDDGQRVSTKRTRFRSWTQSLKWPFTEGEVREVLADMERLKSLFAIALTKDNLQLSVAMKEEVRAVTKGVESILINQENEQRKGSLSQLSNINFEATHGDVKSRRASGTGQWLLQSDEYMSWLDSSTNAIFWCRGIPGAGKTILASRVIDHLRALKASNPNIGVAGLYCSYRDPQTTENLLGSLVQQLAWPLDNIPVSISKDVSPTTKPIVEALIGIISSYEQTFVVVDALDECPNKLDLLKELSKLARSLSNTGSSLCALVTSRSGITDIERNLQADMQLEIRSHDNDVRLYLQESLHGQQYLSRWISTSPELENSIIDAILPRLSGMFLLARLYIDIIAQIPTKRKVRKALETLPETIDSTYADAWDRICSQKPEPADIGKKVLSWIICARRPMQVQELQYALAIEKDDFVLDEEGILDIDSLTSFCAGLVVIDEQSGTISLVHPTTNEYFHKHKCGLLPSADELLAVTCTTHLLMKDFRTQGACSTPDQFNDRCRKNELLGYAAVHWGTHVRLSASKFSSDLASTLLENEKARSAAVQNLVINTDGSPDRRYGPEWPWLSNSETEADRCARIDFHNSKKAVGALHLAAYFGLVDIANNLLEDTHEIDEPDSMSGTPIHWALLGNQNAMVKYLLERGADATAQRLGNPFQALRRWPRPEQYIFPIYIAALQDNTEAIELLLRYITDADERPNMLAAALDVGLRHEHEAAVDLLLSKMANLVDHHLPIDFVVQHGTVQMFKKLVRAGFSKYMLQFALKLSANIADYERIALLLESGANINGDDPTSNRCRDDSHFQETDFTRRMGLEDDAYSRIPETVPSPGAIMGSGSQKQGTRGNQIWCDVPLVTVIHSSGTMSTLRYEVNYDPFGCFDLLIKAGADVNIIAERDYCYADDMIPQGDWRMYSYPRGRLTTPLLTASYLGNLTMIRTLVERGADVNFNLGSRYNVLTSVLHSEGYPEVLSSGLGKGEGISTIQRVRATLQLLIQLGADASLCVPVDKARIERVLNMSREDCDHLSALQRLISYPDPSFRSFKSRQEELARIVLGGAKPELCGTREKEMVGKLLGQSKEGIEELDRERLDRLAALKKHRDRRYRAQPYPERYYWESSDSVASS